VKKKQFASLLAWFGIALGLAQLLVPKQLGRTIGIGGSTAAMRALGAREVASGIALLAQQRPDESVWARVWGDVMDLALLNVALRSRESDTMRVAATTAAVVAVTAADVLCAQQPQ
jgi:hypothetical protein